MQLAALARELGTPLSPTELAAAMQVLDADKNGTVEVSELRGYIESRVRGEAGAQDGGSAAFNAMMQQFFETGEVTKQGWASVVNASGTQFFVLDAGDGDGGGHEAPKSATRDTDEEEKEDAADGDGVVKEQLVDHAAAAAPEPDARPGGDDATAAKPAAAPPASTSNIMARLHEADELRTHESTADVSRAATL